MREIAKIEKISYSKINQNIKNYKIEHQGTIQWGNSNSRTVKLYDREKTMEAIRLAIAESVTKKKRPRINEDNLTYAPRCIPKNMLPLSAFWTMKTKKRKRK